MIIKCSKDGWSDVWKEFNIILGKGCRELGKGFLNVSCYKMNKVLYSVF